MEKKIIAVIGVVILLVSMFAACGKKTITTDNGREYILATDDEGNTMANNSGDVAVYVTDGNGDYVKDDNGEKQTNYVAFPEMIVGKNKVETANYILTFKNRGWTLSDRGEFVKNDTEENVYIKVMSLGSVAEGQTIDIVGNGIAAETEAFLTEVKNVYPDTVINVSDAKITDDAVDAKVIECVIKDTDGNMVRYMHGTHFISNGELFKVEYACLDGQYYDPTFDIMAVINTGLVIK